MNNKKTRVKRSIIWTLPENEFIQLIKESKRMKDVFLFFGLANKGGNFKTLKQRIVFLDLDTSHFLSREKSSIQTREMTLEKLKKEWLIQGSTNNRTHIKSYLLKFDLLDYKCKKCNCDGFWKDEPLALQLEHINGTSNDNRLENLCFLCPNCHSQTSTFAGKSNKKEPKLCNCGNKIRKESKICAKCRQDSSQKIIWPEIEELQKTLWEKPTIKIAKEIGVSDMAISNFCKKHNLTKPPRGFWKKAGAMGFEPILELNP